MQSVTQAVNKALFKLKPPRTLTGRVFSDRMQKSCTVAVTRLVYEKRIGRYIRRQKKFMCHDEYNECRIGDIVKIKACEKLSKRKYFQVAQIVLPARKGTDPLLPVEAQLPTTTRERALTPRTFFPNDRYTENVDGLFSPYIVDKVKPIYGEAAAAAAPKQ